MGMPWVLMDSETANRSTSSWTAAMKASHSRSGSGPCRTRKGFASSSCIRYRASLGGLYSVQAFSTKVIGGLRER